jgi:mRNA interferase MazF
VARQAYFPDRGDLVHLDFSPSAAHEMAQRHYGLVRSSRSFSKATGCMLVCPITSNTSPWPFDVRLGKGILPAKQGQEVDSAILTDQVKSVDFRDRDCAYVAKAPDEVLDEALAKVRAIVDSDDVMEELRG